MDLHVFFLGAIAYKVFRDWLYLPHDFLDQTRYNTVGTLSRQPVGGVPCRARRSNRHRVSEYRINAVVGAETASSHKHRGVDLCPNCSNHFQLFLLLRFAWTCRYTACFNNHQKNIRRIIRSSNRLCRRLFSRNTPSSCMIWTLRTLPRMITFY